MRSQNMLVIDGQGHATEFMVACREIAQCTLRGKDRWWFQSVEGTLDGEEANRVSEMDWHVIIEYGE